LRYFNPTQSWISDRVAKGLVEALMLKRADICIYMAQQKDTFGKDSEASVTLGQGKSVIVYVPKLVDSVLNIDSEITGKMKWNELMEELERTGVKRDDIDEDENKEQLHARLIHKRLDQATDEDYIRIIKKHWADFDIEETLKDELLIEKEGSDILIYEKTRKLVDNLTQWLHKVLSENITNSTLTEDVKKKLKAILVKTTMKFESRAKTFREIHPLALQIIHSSRILNGILVVRSTDMCAKLILSLIENKLDVKLDDKDENNYRLIEENTSSTIRVISKHQLIANAFKTYYKKINEI
jgi:hypothetical protein